MQRSLPCPRQVTFSHHHVGKDRFRVARWPAETPRPARPLLFFSGIGANIELLAPFLEQLSGRDVVTLDILGLGGSSESLQPYRLSAMAEAAAQIVTELGYDGSQLGRYARARVRLSPATQSEAAGSRRDLARYADGPG